MSSPCAWCAGRCAGADLTPLLAPELRWLWEQVGKAGDRRGDPDLITGVLTVAAPPDAEGRSAAAGLLGGALRADQRRRIDLTDLTARLRQRGNDLSPGAVAAHALRRRLAVRAIARAARQDAQTELCTRLDGMFAALPAHVATIVDPATAWARLLRTGTVTRLLARADSELLLGRAARVLTALPEPGRRVDRRTLVPGAPHALDEGQPLAWLVLALTNQNGQRPRRAWHALGVDIDDLTGGLLTVGIHPHGWSVPAGAVCTLPPRELAQVSWPDPPGEKQWVFVTENPSVVAAVADKVHEQVAHGGAAPQVRLLCTVGTPSKLEVAAIAALADVGWQVAVRADFDLAGLFHVRTLLTACPSAVPWRMDTRTYREAATPAGGGLDVTADDTPWDDHLGEAMRAVGALVFEEDLLDQLMDDVLIGRPPLG